MKVKIHYGMAAAGSEDKPGSGAGHQLSVVSDLGDEDHLKI